MKHTLSILALGLIAFPSSAMATETLYSISESFTISAYFFGTFVYNSTTSSISQLGGSATLGGASANLTNDFNVAYHITPALQADGFGGVTDTVCNGLGINGNICVYLDVLATNPTTLSTASHTGTPFNLYVNNDVPVSGGVASYSIQSLGPVAAVPEPASWITLLFGFLFIGAARRYRLRCVSGIPDIRGNRKLSRWVK